MGRRYWTLVAAVVVLVGILVCGASGRKAKGSDSVETERQVTESEVSAAALKALQKMAGKAEITEFAEEIEGGSTFYEASWESRGGKNVDVLVTKAGDLVEREEEIAAGKLPGTVLKAARKAAGKGTELLCEKKTMILYEVKFTKSDGLHEVLLAPDGRVVEEDVEKAEPEDDEEEDEDDEDEDDGDDEDEDDEDEDDDDEDEDDEDEDEDGDDEDEDDDDDEEDDDEGEDDEDEDDDDGDDEDDDDDDDEHEHEHDDDDDDE